MSYVNIININIIFNFFYKGNGQILFKKTTKVRRTELIVESLKLLVYWSDGSNKNHKKKFDSFVGSTNPYQFTSQPTQSLVLNQYILTNSRSNQLIWSCSKNHARNIVKEWHFVVTLRTKPQPRTQTVRFNHFKINGD